ncbi:YraN family protein [Gemmatimonadota bacterium]
MEIGRLGEEEAARYLQARGWTILGRNVRAGRREVDLVALRGRVLAFVEVKCRSGRGWGHPLEAITSLKQGDVARVARKWVLDGGLPPGTVVRFDAIGVLLLRGMPPEITHVPDAWRLT